MPTGTTEPFHCAAQALILSMAASASRWVLWKQWSEMRQGAEIVFEVVAIQFQGKLRVVEFGDDLLVHMQGLALGVHDIQFELGAECQIACAEIRSLQQQFERFEIGAQPLSEVLEFFAAEFEIGDFLTHFPLYAQ